MRRTKTKRIVLVLAVWVALMAAWSLGVMLLWNGVVLDIAPVSRIGFWQALGLGVLCRFLTHTYQAKAE